MDDSTPGELKDDAKVAVSWLGAHPRITWFVAGLFCGMMLVALVSCANTPGYFGVVGPSPKQETK